MTERRYIGKAWGVDRNSGRTIAFATGTASSGIMSMMMYNSTEYNNKLVYHLMPMVYDAYSWFDRVHIDLPTGVSELEWPVSYRLKITLGGTPVGSVGLSAYLDGNSTSGNWNPEDSPSSNIIDAATGGEGTVVYTYHIASPNLHGIQQATVILKLNQLATNSVSKICIDSIELEVL